MDHDVQNVPRSPAAIFLSFNLKSRNVPAKPEERFSGWAQLYLEIDNGDSAYAARPVTIASRSVVSKNQSAATDSLMIGRLGVMAYISRVTPLSAARAC